MTSIHIYTMYNRFEYTKIMNINYNVLMYNNYL